MPGTVALLVNGRLPDAGCDEVLAGQRKDTPMRSIIVANIMTIDGYYAGPGNNPMVLNMDHSFDSYNLERMRSAGTILLGRSSFELFSSFWPMVADAPEDPANPSLSATNREFSRLYRDVPKLVVSDTLAVAPENAWVGTTEVVPRTEAVARLERERAGDGGDIVIFASHVLWNGLLSDGLVDEVHLIVGPAAIGDGVPIFEHPAALELVEARQLEGSGNVLHRYIPSH
jgi:dihydrofolate reductase